MHYPGYRLFLFIGTLLFGGWSSTLLAYVPEKMPEITSASPSSFLLVAHPKMRDPRFSKTVVLVSRHGRTGPVGIIVNRQQNITLDQLFPEYTGAGELNLFTGGPVYPKQISFLVRGGEAVAGALTISQDLYLAYDTPILGELLSGKRPYSGLRVVHGLASWAPGQLENEIRQGAWLVLPLDDAAIFDIPPVEMWRELYRRAQQHD